MKVSESLTMSSANLPSDDDCRGDNEQNDEETKANEPEIHFGGGLGPPPDDD